MTPNELRGMAVSVMERLRGGEKIGPIPTRGGPIQVGIEDLSDYRSDLASEIAVALLGLATGHAVTAAVSYRKQTKAAPRVEGRDYDALPGVNHDALMGPLSCFRTKAGALRLTVLTPFRALNGESGWATMIPTGIMGFRIQATAAAAAPTPSGGSA